MADPLSETPLKTTPGGPPEQLFVQSYSGDHGEPSFATVLGTGEIGPRRGRPAAPSGSRRSTDSIRVVHPEGTQREAAKSRILFVLCIQEEQQSAQKSAHKMRSPHARARSPQRCTGGAREVHGRCTGGGREVDGRWTGGGREVHGRCTGGARGSAELEHRFATVLGTKEIQLPADRQ